MQGQSSAYEYFYVTYEGTEGTARHWTFIVQRQTYDHNTQTWNPRRKCLVVSIKPQTQNMSWQNFIESAAQDASNIARNTPNVSFFVGGLNVFHGCNVKIVEGELEVGFLHYYRNLAFGQYIAAYLKTLAVSNDDFMKSHGN